MSDILLATINARYIHASLGLRYLYANMGELKSRTSLCEFTLEQRSEDIVEQLLAREPVIIGFGMYIWNALETLSVVQLLKLVRPEIKIILGGPEISFETTQQSIFNLADQVITGQADKAFAENCALMLANKSVPKLVSPLPLQLDQINLPYSEYTQEDIAQRVVYVEASRGCPFKCEFCLSSLDKTATPFSLDGFLDEMRQLLDRGARSFKFVDRTFNLKIDNCVRILDFFLDAIENQELTLFLHFELIPDRLPEAIKSRLTRFPPGSLQFEIGIQSFNPEVQQLISRKQDGEKTIANMRWLREHTGAHIHADLIFGLPGETMESFGLGFNKLLALEPQEIQLGILKRLRGTPIDRHTNDYDMRYMSTPPYRILSNKDNNFQQVQRMVRFARYWDLLANSGRFPGTLPLLLGNNAFQGFMRMSDWLFATTGQTHKISLIRLFQLVKEFLLVEAKLDEEVVIQCLSADAEHNSIQKEFRLKLARSGKKQAKAQVANQRQLRHH